MTSCGTDTVVGARDVYGRCVGTRDSLKEGVLVRADGTYVGFTEGVFVREEGTYVGFVVGDL